MYCKNIKWIKFFFTTLMIVFISLSQINIVNAEASFGHLYGDKDFKKKMIAVMGNVNESVPKKSVVYVSKNGSDSNKGTKRKPYKSFKRAISKLRPGDTLVIRKGTYKEPLNLLLNGKKNAYITIRNYPGEKVILDGTGKGNGTIMVNLNNSSYLRIHGLEIRNIKGLDVAGIRLENGSHHIFLTKNRIHNVKVSADKKDACANGIILWGENEKKAIHNIFIFANTIYNCKTGWAECISITGNNKYVNVIKNTIKNTGNIGIDFSGNYGYCSKASVDFPRYCVASDNNVVNCVSKYATSYGLYVDGGQNIVLENNTVRACGGGIEVGAEQVASKKKYAVRNIKVQNNYLVNNKENGLTVGGYATNLGNVYKVLLKDNICINNGKRGENLTISKAEDVYIKGNVFSNTKSNATIVYMPFSSKYTRNITFKKNRYYSAGGKKKAIFYFKGKEYKSYAKWLKVSKEKGSAFKKYNKKSKSDNFKYK
ncbi:right-handed parallel beta-helix repeat-containing protein [Anaerosacchariphilus polymeriproducens]|uniref:Right handed beta helix domain-containing protein n=1 Tax=Anaerosacchariphilus polymeriproducens TaxID=1812858 RepID=A0A371AWJ4_9FIRM|nr:right-handed parallel beta-helix repeat-containing protein [Anaerosacchariphilus polymeriproducens]RDU23956.1 hypothetical protein DWV06_06585 [Anaerosacchariphilus polymeriproducens]